MKKVDFLGLAGHCDFSVFPKIHFFTSKNPKNRIFPIKPTRIPSKSRCKPIKDNENPYKNRLKRPENSEKMRFSRGISL